MSSNGDVSNKSSGKKCGWGVEDEGLAGGILLGSETTRRAGRMDLDLVNVFSRRSPFCIGLSPAEETARDGVIVEGVEGRVAGGEGMIELGSTCASGKTRRGETGTSLGR